MEYFKITKETEKWFLPILTDVIKLRLRMEPDVFAVGAVKDKKACGVLVFELGTDAAEIIYIAVSDSARRQGVGTGMLGYLCEHARLGDTGVGCSFTAADKSDPLYLFFEAQSAFTTVRDEGFVCAVTMEQLKKTSLINENKTPHVQQFFSLPGLRQAAFFSDMKARGYYLPAKNDEYVKPLCICIENGGNIDAAVFVEKESGINLLLSFAYCSKAGSRGLVSLFSEDARRMTAKLPADSRLYIATVTPQSAAIAERLLPEYEVTEYFFRSEWDMGE